VFACEYAAQVVGLLGVGSLGDDRRASMHLANKSDAHVGCLRSCRFFKEDQVFSRRSAPATVFGGPVDARVSSIEQHSLPLSVVDASTWPIIG
jgi:hypothetical protein